MVKALHRAGIEVILDVVYNHTAEGNHLGPMLSFRGVDNQSYYRLVPDDPRFYMDYTGTGNTLNPVHPTRAAADHGLAAVLRHRVPRRRVPLRPRVGARARVLRGRPPLGLLRHHPPGPDPLPGEADRRAVGRRAGRLPGRELPDPLVGVERHLPRHDARLLARTRRRCATSHRASAARPTSTRPTAAGRSRRSTSSPRTTASRCATSSRTTTSTTRRTARRTATAPTTTARGTAASRARPTIPSVNALRARQQRNFLATLLLSQGVPMLLGGDEIGRTQRGNNNAWCQDNEISWIDWAAGDEELLAFTRRLIELRRAHPVFRRTKFFDGTGEQLPDVWWMRPDGRRMTRRDWDNTESRAIGVLPERRRARNRDAARRGGARRLVPAALQRASSRRSRSGCRPGASARAGSSCSSTGNCACDRPVPGGDVVVESRSLALFRRV